MGKSKNLFFSIWLSLVCIVVFVLQTIIPGLTEIFDLNKSVYSGEVWRYVTSIFLHASITHLLFNLFALLFFGIALESLIGSRKFLLVFFVSGILANVVSVNFYDSSLGASGAIMGIIGTATVINPMMMVWAFGVIMPIFAAAIVWVIGDLIGIFYPQGVGNIAHLSGMGVGLLIGLLWRDWSKKEEKKREVMIPNQYLRFWEDRYMK